MKKGEKRGKTISLPDERKLGYLIIGEGRPVFWFHGLPDSRISVLNLSKISGPLKIIGVDRPGFGLSSFTTQRRISDFAEDISFLADQLKIDKFALVGWSGGGHYAITCAALLAERVTKVVVISGLSLPLDTSEMNSMNKMIYDNGTKPIIGSTIQKQARGRFFQFLSDPRKFARTNAGKYFLQQYPEVDHNFWISKDKGSSSKTENGFSPFFGNQAKINCPGLTFILLSNFKMNKSSAICLFSLTKYFLYFIINLSFKRLVT